MQPFTAVLIDDDIVVPTRSEADSLDSDAYGYWGDDKLLHLEPSEVLYNVERQKIMVIDENKNAKLSFKELLNLFNKQDSGVWEQFIVFKDLRQRGFVIRKDISSGRYIVWERGMYNQEGPNYRILIVSEGSPRYPADFYDSIIESDKLSLETKLAVIDRRGEVVYYGLSEAFNEYPSGS